jgi:hypothetical protein
MKLWQTGIFILITLFSTNLQAEIKVFDNSNNFLGYLAGTGDVSGNKTVRLFLPGSNRFVRYIYHSYLHLDIETTRLYYLTSHCDGQKYIEVSSTPYNDIRKLGTTTDLYVGEGSKTFYLNYKSYSDGVICTSSSNVLHFMKAVPVAPETVPLSLDSFSGGLPLKFKWQGPGSVMYPIAVPAK